MHTSRLLTCAACLLLLGWLAGCDDPSTVGAGLIGEQGGGPVAVSLPPRFEPDSVRDVTGLTTRVLAGVVDDPLLGRIEATGYIDFYNPIGAPEEYEDETLTGASLRLVPNDVYGDTTGTVTLRLYDMAEEWEAAGAPADTSLQPIVRSPIAEYAVAAGDTLVMLDLPASWLSANEDVLRDTSFADAFHGFQLRPVSGEAVLGFGALASDLRVTTPTDTVTYPARPTPASAPKVLTTVDREIPPEIPPGRVLVQDGLGRAVSITVALPDSLRDLPLNQVDFQLNADLETLSQAPPNFVRPRLGTLLLSVFSDDPEVEEPLSLARLQLDETTGRYVVTTGGELRALQTLLQDALLGDLEVRLRLSAPAFTSNRAPTNTLNATLLYAGPQTLPLGAEPSRIVLIVTPLGD